MLLDVQEVQSVDVDQLQFFLFGQQSGTIVGVSEGPSPPQSHPLIGQAVLRKVNQPALTS